jgi:hypothetical protein
MAALKAVLIFISVILGTCEALAEDRGPWGIVTGAAGYQGEFFAGGLYRFNERHTMVMTLGTFTLDYTRAQLNVGYVYSPYEMNLSEHTRWTVLDCGVSLSFALDRDNYFLKSPVQYPQSNYYDQTKDRAALQIGTSLEPFDGGISIRYFVSLLTVGGVAFFNNREGYRQFLSSGISLKFPL